MGLLVKGADLLVKGMATSLVSLQAGMLNHRLYQASAIPERYRKAMESILEDIWEEKEILTQIDRIRELTKDHLHDGQRRGAGMGGGDSDVLVGIQWNQLADAAQRNTAQLALLRIVESSLNPNLTVGP